MPASGSVSREARFLLPENMPGKGDVTFMTYMQTIVPNLVVQGPPASYSDGNIEEKALVVIWCSAVASSNAYREFSACVMLTTMRVYIFEVVEYQGSAGDQIELGLIEGRRLSDIEKLVLSVGEAYVRLDFGTLKNSGDESRVALFTSPAARIEDFIGHLKTAIKRSFEDVDLYEDPCIVPASDSEARLKDALQNHDVSSEFSIEILFYSIIQLVPKDVATSPLLIRSIVVTRHYIWVLCENYLYVVGSGSSQFTVECAIPVCSKVSTIKIYDSDSFFTPPSEPGKLRVLDMMTHFIGYGLSMSFDLDFEGSHLLNFRVPTVSQRDKFLAAFMHARQELNEKSGVTHGLKRRVSKSKMAGTTSKSAVRKNNFVSMDCKLWAASTRLSASHMKLPVIQMNSSNLGGSNERRRDKVGGTSYEISELVGRSSAPPSVDRIRTAVAASSDCISSESSSFDSQSMDNIASASSAALAGFVDISDDTRPVTLFPSYPSRRLLDHLALCNEQGALLECLPSALRCLACYSGEELVSFFHSSVTAPDVGVAGGLLATNTNVGRKSEELCHLMWCSVVLPECPYAEFFACVMLGLQAVYVISDVTVEKTTAKPVANRQVIQQHRRNWSDASSNSHEFNDGISVGSATVSPMATIHRSQVACVLRVIAFNALKEVRVGLFDQSVRLAYDNMASALCFLSKNAASTDEFIRHLTNALSSQRPSLPSPEQVMETNDEDDFYSTFLRCRQPHISEYIHPSKVKFVSPNDDLLLELSDFVCSCLRELGDDFNVYLPAALSSFEKISVLQYLLVQRTDTHTSFNDTSVVAAGSYESRSLVITETHVVLVREDYVNYPLLPASSPLPANPHYVLDQIKPIFELRRIVVSDFTSHDITLVFVRRSNTYARDPTEITVDENSDYFGSYGASKSSFIEAAGQIPVDRCSVSADDTATESQVRCNRQKGSQVNADDTKWTVWVHSIEDKQRLIKIVSRQWEEMVPGRRLSVKLNS